MRASVIIPVYNVEKYLEKCLDSVLNQTIKDYEIICINDCSPDKSQDILDQYKKIYGEKIRVIKNEQNLGQGRSRMRGVDCAKGEYVFFVDSDDHIAPDYLETFLNEVQNESYDMVIAGYTKDIDGKYVKHDVKDNKWTRVCYPVACCKMYRRQFLLHHHIDFSSVRIGEDIYFTLDLFCSNAKTKIISYFGYYYYLNVQSTTKTITYEKKHEAYVAEMFRLLLKKYDLGLIDTEKRYMIEYAYIANMINALITYGHGCKPKLMKCKYDFFLKDMYEKFPNILKNPYLKFRKAKGVPLKIRIAVSISSGCMRVGLGRLLYMLISII